MLKGIKQFLHMIHNTALIKSSKIDNTWIRWKTISYQKISGWGFTSRAEKILQRKMFFSKWFRKTSKNILRSKFFFK